MRTVNQVWDYIVQNQLLDTITEDRCWVCADGHLYVEYYDEDYNGELTVHPLEYVERIDDNVAEITLHKYFLGDDWNELNRRCNVVLKNAYREYLKQQLSYLEGM
jgi:hypothetical protein